MLTSIFLYNIGVGLSGAVQVLACWRSQVLSPTEAVSRLLVVACCWQSCPLWVIAVCERPIVVDCLLCYPGNTLSTQRLEGLSCPVGHVRRYTFLKLFLFYLFILPSLSFICLMLGWFVAGCTHSTTRRIVPTAPYLHFTPPLLARASSEDVGGKLTLHNLTLPLSHKCVGALLSACICCDLIVAVPSLQTFQTVGKIHQPKSSTPHPPLPTPIQPFPTLRPPTQSNQKPQVNLKYTSFFILERRRRKRLCLCRYRHHWHTLEIEEVKSVDFGHGKKEDGCEPYSFSYVSPTLDRRAVFCSSLWFVLLLFQDKKQVARKATTRRAETALWVSICTFIGVLGLCLKLLVHNLLVVCLKLRVRNNVYVR
jgi:hypothetical protein